MNISKNFIFVDIQEQKAFLFDNKNLVKTYKVSTSRNPPSCVENSLGTPLGWHKIDGKIGENSPYGMIFKARKETGKTFLELTDELSKTMQNVITSRILRLRGLESGKNAGGLVDTFNRYVYLHGTNQEDKLGLPNSHGCVLFSNNDIIELFDKVENGSLVYISLGLQK